MFWQRLCELCDKMGKKPNSVCRELGLSTAISTKWKNGAVPNAEILLKLADYFSVTVDYLLGRDNVIQKIEPNLKDEGVALYEQLDDNDRAEIRGEMRHMLKSDKYNQETADLA